MNINWPSRLYGTSSLNIGPLLLLKMKEKYVKKYLGNYLSLSMSLAQCFQWSVANNGAGMLSVVSK